MWFPDWLYAVLPILYAVMAGVVLAVFGINGPALLTVAMLFLAASLTTVWRYRTRLEL